MLLKKVFVGLIACQLAILPGLAQAQSSHFDRAFAPQGAEARVSFTIPLGNSPDKTKTAPRLGFAVRNYEQSSRSSTDWMLADADPYREMRLGLTLEDTPTLMLNDEVLHMPQDEQANIGTAGKIGIGVVAVALVGVAIIAIALVDCESQEGGCFSDDG